MRNRTATATFLPIRLRDSIPEHAARRVFRASLLVPRATVDETPGGLVSARRD
ncbi:hypothetical protein [Halorussus halophilus]|uniref:hypothetical protein n=1 Tax=Halorussus halophilus TaxID=2650975 RepID=UPI0017887A5F|nr:hypothetical protein [Halorussus halophilus]